MQKYEKGLLHIWQQENSRVSVHDNGNTDNCLDHWGHLFIKQRPTFVCSTSSGRIYFLCLILAVGFRTLNLVGNACDSICPTWQPSLLHQCSVSPLRCEQHPLGCSGGQAAHGSRCPSLSRSHRRGQLPRTWFLSSVLLGMSNISQLALDVTAAKV